MDKNKLIDECKTIVQSKINNLKQELDQLDSSSQNETKSSMGDKYETSREIIAQERNKIVQQLSINNNHLSLLNQINLSKTYSNVEFGSLVTTSNGLFFISSAIGQVKIGNELVFVVSSLAPISQAMMDKTAPEKFSFNQKDFTILQII